MLQGGQGRPRPGRTRPRCVCGCATALWEGVAVGGAFLWEVCCGREL
ncbi:hypothetical protein [Lysobacter gummosus]